MKNWEKILVLYVGLLVVFIIEAILAYQNNTDLMYFWIAVLFATGVLIATTYVSRKLSDRTDQKIDDVLQRVKQIQERLEGLHKP